MCRPPITGMFKNLVLGLLQTNCLSETNTASAGVASKEAEEVFLNISSKSSDGEGAQGMGHRRSLRIAEAQVHAPLRRNCSVEPPDILEVGAQPPAETACGVDADASQHRRSAPSGRTPGRLYFVITAQSRSAYNGNGCSGIWCWVHCRASADRVFWSQDQVLFSTSSHRFAIIIN